MTLEDVRRRISEIMLEMHDDESAHGMTDQLHIDVLRAIANDECDDIEGCAAMALRTEEMEFERWCA